MKSSSATLSGYQKKVSDSSATSEVAPEIATEVAPEAVPKATTVVVTVTKIEETVKFYIPELEEKETRTKHKKGNKQPTLGLTEFAEGASVTCEPQYGFLPCTSELWGHLFLIVVYQYLMSIGQSYISNGSDKFFGLIGPGIFGASLFHILANFPMLFLILGKLHFFPF
ncbi:EF-hand domain pair [Artemisia annua]|uniref:EF-hand domain pair n=1 Tax=Artemisia annua TaxID=35608 RepID=A0A2U1KAL6_ARTAN|nr:EF-hand domain pair [Artemisia annua]